MISGDLDGSPGSRYSEPEIQNRACAVDRKNVKGILNLLKNRRISMEIHIKPVSKIRKMNISPPSQCQF